MLYSIIFIVVFLAVAFFHLVQGFFSAFISLVLTLVAAAVALGLSEQIVFAMNGKTGDFATSLVICGLFGVSYFVLRLIFDSAVPGNMNFGSLPDKIGGGVCGIVAGLITAGVLAIAGNALPFRAELAMYAPWSTETEQVSFGSVPGWTKYGRNDTFVERLYINDMVKDAVLDESKTNAMMLPVDKYAQQYIAMVSSGSLSGDVNWSDRHPNYTLELAAQRIGLQPGAKHTAFPEKKSPIEVLDIFKVAPAGFPMIVGDMKEYRVNINDTRTTLKAEAGKSLVVVRVGFNGGDVTEKDGRVRFSTSSFRLVAGAEGAKKNFYPIAVLQTPKLAVEQRPDDFLIAEGSAGVDLVFEVDSEVLFDEQAPEAKVKPGAFVEFKRFAWVSIDGRDVKPQGQLQEDPRTFDSVLRRIDWAGRIKEAK